MFWYSDPLKLPKALMGNTVLFLYQLYLDGLTLRDFRFFLLELCEKNILLLHSMSQKCVVTLLLLTLLNSC